MNSEREAARQGLRARWRRKVAISLNTAASLLLAGFLLLMVNYLSYRHYSRADWSRTQYYTLSEKTLGLLGSLTNQVDVTVFFTPGHEVYEDVENLLQEYEYASPMIRVQKVDPHRDLARTESLARKYEVDLLNVVVFDNQGRTKYVNASDIVEMDYSATRFGQEPARSAFRGEQAFSSAIQSITQSSMPAVYFLQGHGERDIEDFDRATGLSEITKQIRRDNIEVRSLVLGEAQVLPDDADALILAGPEKKLSQPEVNLLGEYLQANGRMLILLDAATSTGLDGLLAEWGIGVTDDVVVDAERTLTGRELFLMEYGSHPVTRGLHGVASIMYFPRSVAPLERAEDDTDPADRPRVTRLASSSPAGWAETDLDQNPMKFDPEFDKPGPVSVAVAVERGPVPGIDVELRPTRLVVFGDSDFVSNSALSGGNMDLFMNALNWLLERDELIAIAPKPVDELRLVMTGAQLRTLLLVVVLGIPGAVGAVGALVWFRRRT